MTSLTTLSPIAIVLLLICAVVIVQFARERVAAFIYCITPVKKVSVAPSPAEPRPTGARGGGFPAGLLQRADLCAVPDEPAQRAPAVISRGVQQR